MLPLISVAHLLAVFLVLGGMPAFAAAESRNPSTEVSGEFQLKHFPALRWNAVVGLSSSTPPERLIEASVEGTGLSLRGQLKLDPAPGTGRWTLDSATLALETWFAPLVDVLGFDRAAGDLSLVGELHAHGGGTLDRGDPRGILQVNLSKATLASESRALRISGMELSGAAEGPAPLRSIGAPSLSFSDANFGGIAARSGHIDFIITENRELHIQRAHIEVLGGTVELRDERIPLESILAGEVSASLHLSHLSMRDISALLPDVIAEARGRVSGEIRVGWKPGEGFKLGNGRLQIERPESVEIRLTPQPGFLTSHTPERLTLLPSWTGALQKWFSLRNPAYETLRQIEMGLMSLQVETLSAEVHPAGDSMGRSATVRISARPAVASAVDRIDFEVNVSGPLDEVIKLGMNHKVSIRNGSVP